MLFKNTGVFPMRININGRSLLVNPTETVSMEETEYRAIRYLFPKLQPVEEVITTKPTKIEVKGKKAKNGKGKK